MKSAPNNVTSPHNWLTLKLHNHSPFSKFDPKSKAKQLCSKNSNDVAIGKGKAWELCSKYDSGVATGRGEGMGIVFQKQK